MRIVHIIGQGLTHPCVRIDKDGRRGARRRMPQRRHPRQPSKPRHACGPLSPPSNVPDQDEYWRRQMLTIKTVISDHPFAASYCLSIRRYSTGP